MRRLRLYRVARDRAGLQFSPRATEILTSINSFDDPIQVSGGRVLSVMAYRQRVDPEVIAHGIDEIPTPTRNRRGLHWIPSSR